MKNSKFNFVGTFLEISLTWYVHFMAACDDYFEAVCEIDENKSFKYDHTG